MENQTKSLEELGFSKISIDSYEGNEPYLFISYSHADTATVDKILRILDREKFRMWYDDTMEIGENVKKIGEGAFYKCSSLEEIVIPESVTK